MSVHDVCTLYQVCRGMQLYLSAHKVIQLISTIYFIYYTIPYQVGLLVVFFGEYQ